MQQEIDALKIALLQKDDEAGQAAAINVLGAALLLFERGVQALETIASADAYNAAADKYAGALRALGHGDKLPEPPQAALPAPQKETT